MSLSQSVFEFFSIGIGIARDFSVALYKSLVRRCWRPQWIDAGAEIKNLTGFDAGALRPPIDITAVCSVELRLYPRVVASSAKVASERIAVTRHKTRPSFNISILTSVKSSPI